ncbi:hypothetical protein K470DRAFT_257715 [Piedraia hortae CBS 480.64]|uniref:DnaJ homologue subfamily C member 28 conserved domain-containing protein n=1 Tax=Piedraia hortae CBS 480.64 TaxID=1314780 RepID=A0A6A7BZL1_9PEZI|nr:hypothetical protein K470DRAFT_257715 [Piedraia hortae CBS 480.64]
MKQRIRERIAQASFSSEHAGALAQANLPPGAGKAAQDIVGATPWSGEESVADGALRMLTDKYKPKPSGVRMPTRVDTGRPSKSDSGSRLANARDSSSAYATLKDGSMSDEERHRFRQEMKARFQSDARSIPASIQALGSLANERIEDAIARGQFRNISIRGQQLQRDHNASSPFIDTTEYLMNRMIQKQDIVPPWIEKQQELAQAVDRFRSRLRADWRRHVARSISSDGGGVAAQVRRAEAHAVAERQMQSKAGVASSGALEDPEGAKGEDWGTVGPFRDRQWEATEARYLCAAVANLNALTRSYNLMAPDLARKPYFHVERELRSCFADVAPTVAEAIRQRARAPPTRDSGAGRAGNGVLERFTLDGAGHVHDERRPQYGFREFWRDLWA